MYKQFVINRTILFIDLVKCRYGMCNIVHFNSVNNKLDIKVNIYQFLPNASDLSDKCHAYTDGYNP